MFIKRCPFCFNEVDFHFEDTTQKYQIKCNNCSEKGLIVYMEDSDPNNLQSIWNKRHLDTILAENTENVINTLKNFCNGNNKVLIKDKLFRNYLYETTKSDFGYLITNDNNIIHCNNSHPEELLKYLGCEILDDETYCEEICIELGIIRLSIHFLCLTIDLPKKFNKNQIDSLFGIITQKYKNLKSYVLYNHKNDKCDVYTNIDDLLFAIGDIKC